METDQLEQALETLGATLESRGESHRLVVIGGGSLLLLRQLSRPTQDLDVVARIGDAGYETADPLPERLVETVRAVGSALGLAADWLNPGPTALLKLKLPPGFEERVEIRQYGGLELHIASRFDQIHFKLYAAVDQDSTSKHAADLRILDPTPQELLAAARWALTHDPSDGFRGVLLQALRSFGVEQTDELI